MKRQIALDTETTGFNFTGRTHEGHNIIEIGAVEIINRRITGNNFHVYLKPSRLIDKEAFKIHGISNQFLQDKPRFQDIAYDLINYLKHAELIIHNAAFDVGFINYEFKKANVNIKLQNICDILDTLYLSRKMFPKKNNKLDALCARFNIDISKRIKHTALLDAELLAKVYLKMTSGQMNFPVNDNINNIPQEQEWIEKNSNITNINLVKPGLPLIILYPSKQELLKHVNILKFMKSNNRSLWLEIEKEKDKDNN